MEGLGRKWQQYSEGRCKTMLWVRVNVLSGFSLSFSVLARPIGECHLDFPAVSKVSLRYYKRMEVPLGRPSTFRAKESSQSLGFEALGSQEAVGLLS